MVSNIESVAREIGEQVPEVTIWQEKAEQVLNSNVVMPTPQTSKAIELAAPNEAAQALDTNEVEESVSDTTKQEDKVYDVTEVMPEFPGGKAEMMKYLMNNIKYPKSAYDTQKQGTVLVGFIVGKDGSINKAKVVKSVDSDLDAEALRIVNSMPKWTPGMQYGKTVEVRCVVPLRFMIPNTKDEAAEQRLKQLQNESVAFVNKAYPGGLQALMAYFGANMRFPMAAQKAGKDKITVMALAFIDKNGKVSVTKPQEAKRYSLGNIQVVGYKSAADNSVSEAEAKKLLEAEVDKVLAKMPKWKVKGKAVNVSFLVDFVLK